MLIWSHFYAREQSGVCWAGQHEKNVGVRHPARRTRSVPKFVATTGPETLAASPRGARSPPGRTVEMASTSAPALATKVRAHVRANPELDA